MAEDLIHPGLDAVKHDIFMLRRLTKLKRMFTPKPGSDCGGKLLHFNGVCGVRAAFSA